MGQSRMRVPGKMAEHTQRRLLHLQVVSQRGCVEARLRGIQLAVMTHLLPETKYPSDRQYPRCSNCSSSYAFFLSVLSQWRPSLAHSVLQRGTWIIGGMLSFINPLKNRNWNCFANQGLYSVFHGATYVKKKPWLWFHHFCLTCSICKVSWCSIYLHHLRWYLEIVFSFENHIDLQGPSLLFV